MFCFQIPFFCKPFHLNLLPNISFSDLFTSSFEKLPKRSQGYPPTHQPRGWGAGIGNTPVAKANLPELLIKKYC